MNIGTIIDNSNYKVKLKNGKILGFVDDFFILSIKEILLHFQTKFV